MKIHRIALVEPTVDAECLTTEVFAQIRAALPFLAGALKNQGYKTTVYCEELIRLEPRFNEIASHDVVGISVTINTVRRGCEIAQSLKKIEPNILIIFGGSCVHSFRDVLLKSGDYILPGRAEVSFPDFLAKLQKDSTQETATQSSKILDFPRQTQNLISDFSTVVGLGGFSERKNIFGLPKPPLYSIFTSTGCVNRCKFCVSDKVYETRILEHVEAEICQILSFHRTLLPPRIMIVDDCPFGDLDYLKELLLLLTRLRKENHFSLMMQFHVLPLTRDEQIAPLMKSAGVQTLLMGFETVSDTSLQEENKGTTKADNIAAIQVCREFDILPYGYFVAGFDADSPDTVDEIFSFILEYQLVAQVLPMGVMDERTLDPYSFGATIFVSHRPKQMSPVQLQKRLLSGYQKIFAPTRFLTMKTLREKLYQSALGPSWKKWKPRVESHINYLTLLEKFN